MTTNFDLVIIGGGILGTCLSYFASGLDSTKKIAVIEQAHKVAHHASGRNTGKVHAPYLYNPDKKKLFAKAAFYGYDMWKEYSEQKGLLFKKDGVIEIASNSDGINTLERHAKWGIRNGLDESDIELMDDTELNKTEPHIKCKAALCVHRDASVNYASLTNALMIDSMNNGTRFFFDSKATKIDQRGDTWNITINNSSTICAKFVINAAGGESIDIAHEMKKVENLTDVHFRGEYWKIPAEYKNLTRASVYSVPAFPEYPFLDPHWIVHADGNCEIGPNAVPVFSPYGYNITENVKEALPKIIEMLGTGARKAIFDGQFQRLAIGEVLSSISKSVMINRVQKFLPDINPNKIIRKGTAGIRSPVIDQDGKFVPDVITVQDKASLHILNYNSPGATGVLPFSAHTLDGLIKAGCINIKETDVQCGSWRFSDIIEKLDGH